MGKVVRAAAIVGAFFVNPYAGLVAFQSLGGARMLGLGPKRPKAESGFRSRVNADPESAQWLVVGQTAVPSTLIYADTEGASNDTMSQIFVHACHGVSAFVSLYINNNLTTYSPSVAGDYAGVLTVQTADGSQTANAFSSVAGGRWGASHIGQGLAMSHFRWTYDSEKLAAGLPQNIQWVVKGIKVYDPRRDTTVGGSGTMRADDESTWAYSAGGSDLGRSPALVELTYRLGWKKNGRLWAGMGEDPDNIDYDSYIAAANICDETVNGKPRYRIDGLLSLADDHNTNLGRIHATCGGRMIDQGGLIAFWVAHDDTADVVMALTDDDYKGDIDWQALPDGDRRNTGRGSFIDPASFYVAQPYEEVVVANAKLEDDDEYLVDDGMSYDMVQDRDQARRLTSIRIWESRQGILSVPIDLRGLKLRPMDVVTLDHDRWSWAAKAFRAERWGLTPDFRVMLTARAIDADEYVDLANVSTSTPATIVPEGYVPALGALATQDTVDYSALTDTTQIKPDNGATRGDNLVRNYDFANGATDWVLPASAAVVAGGAGDPAVGILTFGASGTTAVARANNGDNIAVPPNATRLYVSAKGAASGGGITIKAFVDCCDATGAVVTGGAFTVTIPITVANTYYAINEAIDLPAGTVLIRCGFEVPAIISGTGYATLLRVGFFQENSTVLLDGNGRGRSRRLSGQFAGSGVDRLISTNPLSASTDGGGVATITINAHDEIDDAGTLSFTSSSIGGLSASTTYYVYEDNATYVGGARSYVATTTRANLAAAGRRYVGTITTPASGGSSSGTGGTGGGWSGGGDIP